jgi:alkanesulfonate monooxygenase SsuD/methylene tetrahydromethanopterin reductase-like flavin-dependent oxidoreductase (luciferase family)
VDVGHLIFCASDGYSNISDGQIYAEEVRLATLADELGFDVVWSVEHHFDGYSFVPDNMLMLAHIAGVTSRIDVGSAAIILPWNDPIRVVEKISMLDHLAGGRLRIGFGRGSARMEFAGFREGSMNESRERFDEAAEMILRALETGILEGDGHFYKQPPTVVRPRPERSFTGRIYSVASGDDSLRAAAHLGARLMVPADKTWRSRLDGLNMYRELYSDLHGEPAPTPLCTDYTLCLPDAEQAQELARKYMGEVLDSSWAHYESKGNHFATIKGYERYADSASAVRKMSRDDFLDKVFLGATTWGTPDRILENLRLRHEMLGGFEMSTSFRFGGVPFELAEQSMRLFAAEVLPVLHTW